MSFHEPMNIGLGATSKVNATQYRDGPATPEQTELQYAQGRLNGAVTMAHDRLDVLGARLAPLLQDRPEVTGGALDVVERQCFSQTCRELCAEADRIDGLNRKLMVILQALAL